MINMEVLFPLFFFGFIGYFLFVVFTKKGKGISFGGRIVKTLDKEIKQKQGISNTTIRVHVIKRKKEKNNAVSIELNQHAYLAWSMMPINLSKNEVVELISMLEEAVKV